MASPLGNGAIVETLDKRIIVLQRSAKVGEFPGYFVFPGGHSEVSSLTSQFFVVSCGLSSKYRELRRCKFK